MLLIVEDLHWIDPSTLEFLTLLIDQGPTARLLTLLTCRPEFQTPWGFRAHLTPLTLSRLPRPQATQMTVRVTGGKALPSEVVEQIVTKTDGVPLFVEELTKMVLESGLLREGEERYELTGPLPPLAIPATLHDSLMARLDRLATVKDVAQLGATIGRTFAYELLQAVSPLDGVTLQHGLRQLVEAELVYQRGVPPQATYTFKHALIQDAAYQSLLRSTRQQYHQRLAQVLVERFSETVETQPELLAHHYTEAGLSAQAIPYWQQAGQLPLQRSAYAEAIGHLTTGIEVLQTLPDTPERAQHELALHVALGGALIGTKSYSAPEVEHSFARARALCQQLGETPEFFHILYGLFAHYYVGGKLQTAREVAEQCLHLAQHANDPALFVGAHHALGATCESLGQFVAAHAHLEQGIALYDPKQHRALGALYGHDIGVACLVHAALTLWMLGYPDQAREPRGAHPGRGAVAPVQPRSRPGFCALAPSLPSGGPGRPGAGGGSPDPGDGARISPLGSVWDALWGWALAEQGHGDAGLAQIHQGLAAMRATDTGLSWPSWLTVLIEAYSTVGQAEEGLAVLADAYISWRPLGSISGRPSCIGSRARCC